MKQRIIPSEPEVQSQIQVPNFYPTSFKISSNEPSDTVKSTLDSSKEAGFPFRLDTITSQSEVDHSDNTDTEVGQT